MHTRPSPPTPDTPSPRDDLGDCRVLLVDDSVDALESLGLLLELGGAQVRMASSGVEALRLLDEALPDLLISDLGMPGVNGHDVVHALRARPGGGAVVALALSGFSGGADVEAALASGFDALVGKPASVERLQAAHREVLARRAA